MHIQTHVMSGWCLGNIFDLTARERFFCMLAASLHDLDGLGRLVSEELYWDYHHLVGHNIFFGLLLCGTLTHFSQKRIRAFAVYLALFHVHLLLDYVGSGDDWPIFYVWPVSRWRIQNLDLWHFYSWQNISTGYALVACAVVIAVFKGRTPLEWPMPSLDRQLVEFAQRLRRPSRNSH